MASPQGPIAESDLTVLAELEEELTGEGYTPTVNQIKPLEDDEILTIVREELRVALGGDEHSAIAEQREKALRYYRGERLGNEQEGRSEAILTDVSDTIEWAMPAMMQMFFGSGRLVRYKARDLAGEEGAQQASDVINQLFFEEMDGFRFGYDWMKTALLEKNSQAKAWFEELIEPEIFELREIDEVQLQMVMADPDVTILEVQQREETLRAMVDGQEMELRTFDATVRRTKPLRRLRAEAIPPEEFGIARRARRLDDRTPFCFHRVRYTISDLISMGFSEEEVVDLPSDEFAEFTEGRLTRYASDDTLPDVVERGDVASRTIWLSECYIRIDADGDGFSELRKILVAGDGAKMLSNETVNHLPFADLCPIPTPHKFYGFSLADLVMDLQAYRSTLLRQMLDNIYLTNNSRMAVVEGAVEIDDLLTATVGGIVRQSAPGMIQPIETPTLGPWAFQMLEYLETVRENRTGITRYNQGLDASSLNKTATGINAIMNAANAKLELIARLFMDGYKRLFRILLKELVASPIKERVVKLRGEWVTVSPATWDPNMDVEIEVGLGAGQQAQRIQFLNQVLQLQAEAHARGFGGYLVKPENVYNAMRRLEEAMGFTQENLFFSNPNGQEPPPPPPSPQEIQAKAKEAESQMKLQGERERLEFEQARAAQDGAFKRLELMEQMKLERERLAMEERLAMAKLEIEREKVEVAEMAAEAKSRETERRPANGSAE